jgi:MoxR-like ATPase
MGRVGPGWMLNGISTRRNGTDGCDGRISRYDTEPSVVGHDEIVDGVLTCLFAGGHALLEGVPGLGKTLLIRTAEPRR